MDNIFKALADPTRLKIINLLKKTNGLTLSQLERHIPELSRFGIMKHLGVLEEELLITTQRNGRFKFHYLNPSPLVDIIKPWIKNF